MLWGVMEGRTKDTMEECITDFLRRRPNGNFLILEVDGSGSRVKGWCEVNVVLLLIWGARGYAVAASWGASLG